MASTLTSILLHITFSPKGRAELIAPARERDLYDDIGGICRRMESPSLRSAAPAIIQRLDFKDEVRLMCQKYGVEIVEEFAWDSEVVREQTFGQRRCK